MQVFWHRACQLIGVIAISLTTQKSRENLGMIYYDFGINTFYNIEVEIMLYLISTLHSDTKS